MKGQRGVSLVELLVSLTLLSLIMAVVLGLYDGARKSFRQGENLIEEQQSVRIAFDRLSADVRMAGYHVNPDGAPNRPDEAIEAAYDTAIVVRADYDDGTPDATTPETAAGGGAFTTVLTGNDEIVAYVLAKPGVVGTMFFQADVGEFPRDGLVGDNNCTGLALVQSAPPYTLYRVTLNNDTSLLRTDPRWCVRTPLAENIRSLRFRYYDGAGNLLNPGDPNDPADDIGGNDAQRDIRARIRRIDIEIEGLTRQPEKFWTDPTDTDPTTQHFRKFRLAGEVVPRDTNRIGTLDPGAAALPPQKPSRPTLVAGHCGGLWAGWPPNPPTDLVAYYVLRYGRVSGTPDAQVFSGTSSVYVDSLTHLTTYYVSIQAVDDNGNVSVPSDEVSLATAETTEPQVVANLAASVDQPGAVRLTWDAVTENRNALAGDPASPMIRDLLGYRVYRRTDTTGSFDAGDLVADETQLGPLPTPSVSDRWAANCQDYYYVVRAVDGCGGRGADPTPVLGRAVGTAVPAPPNPFEAFLAGPGQVRLAWQAVALDVNGGPIYVDTYRLYRTALMPQGSTPSSPLDYSFVQQIVLRPGDPTEYLDAFTIPAGQTVFYQLTAADHCPNESNRSTGVEPTCTFNGTVAFTAPLEGDSPVGPTPVRVTVVGGTDSYVRLVLRFDDEDDSSSDTVQIDQPGPTWTYNGWSNSPVHHYVITATVTTSLGCSSSRSIRVGPNP